MDSDSVKIVDSVEPYRRADRDRYVKINISNVEPSRRKNFKKLSEKVTLLTTFGLPYDFQSLMHYGSHFFAKDRMYPTIIPTRGKDHAIGQRERMSRSDIARVNRLYGCSDHYLGDDIPGATPFHEARR